MNIALMKNNKNKYSPQDWAAMENANAIVRNRANILTPERNKKATPDLINITDKKQ